jgi:hypothetical protein
VVSEETGIITLMNNGRMVRNLDEAKLRKALTVLYAPPAQRGPFGPNGPLRLGPKGPGPEPETAEARETSAIT